MKMKFINTRTRITVRLVHHTISLLEHHEALKLLGASSQLGVLPHQPQWLHLGIHRFALLIASNTAETN